MKAKFPKRRINALVGSDCGKNLSQNLFLCPDKSQFVPQIWKRKMHFFIRKQINLMEIICQFGQIIWLILTNKFSNFDKSKKRPGWWWLWDKLVQKSVCAPTFEKARCREGERRRRPIRINHNTNCSAEIYQIYQMYQIYQIY